MKKIISPLFFSFLLFGLAASAQVPGEKKGWSKQEKMEFINSCIGTAREGMSADSARHYCMCMQEKVEAKYPSAADADKLTGEDLSTSEWKKLIQGCLSGHWTDQNRAEFLTSCINTAKNAVPEEKAKSYCECMLFKVEQKYPDATEAAKLTGEDFDRPEWKIAIRNCME